jgi:AraC-like DNA-binding protein
MSISYFWRLGWAFNSYVLARRLDHVRRDLLSLASPQPIWLIALRWGFKDLSTFSKAFKRKFGFSPGRFRSTARPVGRHMDLDVEWALILAKL